MSWRTISESAVLEFNGIELVGRIEHDHLQHALEMVSPDGDSEVLTVDLAASGFVAFPGEVFVRDYSEHSGLPAALVEAGACDLVAEIRVGPFSSSVARMRVLG